MKTEELRIGNILCYKTERNKIKEFAVFFISERIVNNINLKDVSPVKLTKQHLVDFGFKELDEVYSLNNNRYTISSIYQHEGWMLCDGLTVLKIVKYIHELQNLFFELTNITLEG